MVHQGQEEAPERPPGGVEGLRRPPQGQEGVVDHLLGQELLTRHPQGQAVRARGIAPVQLLEGPAVPLAEPAVAFQVETVALVRHAPFLPAAPGTCTVWGASCLRWTLMKAPRSRPRARVVMYSRRTCGLCDKARAVLLAERERTPFVLEEVFIDGDEALERAHGLRVPVVEIDGVERFETFVEPRALRRLVRS